MTQAISRVSSAHIFWFDGKLLSNIEWLNRFNKEYIKTTKANRLSDSLATLRYIVIKSGLLMLEDIEIDNNNRVLSIIRSYMETNYSIRGNNEYN